MTAIYPFTFGALYVWDPAGEKTQRQVYVGVSAGRVNVSDNFRETCTNQRGGNGTPLTLKDVVVQYAGGRNMQEFHYGARIRAVDFAISPYVNRGD